MNSIANLIDNLKHSWSIPKTAIHRGKPVPFELVCRFNKKTSEQTLGDFFAPLSKEIVDFYKITDGASLFKDEKYGQWGLKIYCMDDVQGATKKFFEERNRDFLEGDVIIGEFIGDSDLLLLRCNPSETDYGSIVVVSAIDPRIDWDIPSMYFEGFLSKYIDNQGDKFWEVIQ